MQLAERIAENAEPHLRSGERVIAAFPAQTESQVPAGAAVSVLVIAAIWFELPPLVEVALLVIALLPVIWYFVRNENVVIIATDDRTLVAKSGMIDAAKIHEVIDEFGVDTQIGPAEGFMQEIDVLGRSMYVQKRFHGQIALADERT